MRAIIVANGYVEVDESYADFQQGDDLIIAVDGGTEVALELGLRPAVVVGDLDSLPPQLRATLQESGVQFVVHPPDKDETDTELAILYALEAGASELVLLGAVGDRLDHTLANILLLTMPELERIPTTLIDGDTQLWVLHGGTELELRGEEGDIVTLLPLGRDATGVTTTGLEWALDHATLRPGPARGVSNLMISSSARVQLADGLLLVTHVACEGQEEAADEGQPDAELIEVYATQGHMRASVAKSKLEAAGIPVMLSYDSASRVIGLTVDGIGRVRLLVRAEDAHLARQLLTEEFPLEGV
jgi:thiamine pyrophosphokinase